MRSSRSEYAIARERLANARNRLQGGARARLSGAERFGKRPVILGKVSFRLDGKAFFGDWFVAEGLVVAIKISVAETATLSIGNYVFMNAGTFIEAWNDVQIGDHVLWHRSRR